MPRVLWYRLISFILLYLISDGLTVYRLVRLDCSSGVAYRSAASAESKCVTDCAPCAIAQSPEKVSSCLEERDLLHCEFAFYALLAKRMNVCTDSAAENPGSIFWIPIDEPTWRELKLHDSRGIVLYMFNDTAIRCSEVEAEITAFNIPKDLTCIDPTPYTLRPPYADILDWHDTEVVWKTEVGDGIKVSVDVPIEKEGVFWMLDELEAPLVIAVRFKACQVSFITLPGEGGIVQFATWAPFASRHWSMGTISWLTQGHIFFSVVVYGMVYL